MNLYAQYVIILSAWPRRIDMYFGLQGILEYNNIYFQTTWTDKRAYILRSCWYCFPFNRSN